MKIAICTPFSLQHFSREIPEDKSQCGGHALPSIEEQVRYFAQHSDMEIHVVTQSEDFSNDVIQIGNIYFHLLRAPKHFKLPTFYFFDSARIASRLREIHPEIVEAHWTYEYALGAIRSGYPYIVKIHDWMPKEFQISKEIEFGLKWVIQEYVLHKSRYMSSPSPHFSDLVGTRTSAELCTLPPMVFPRYYELQSTEKENIIFSPCGILKRKNTLTLLRAIKKLRGQLPDVFLVLAGPQRKSSSMYYRECAENIAILEAQNAMKNVAILDYEQLANYYAMSSVVLHASFMEAFGMVVAEAQASAKPVVVARSAGTEFIVEDGETGFIVDPFDVDAYVGKLKLLLENPKLRQEMGRKGRERMKKLLDPERIFEESTRFYRHVISNW
jgi:glycosyltransferase involved in cell wall biosynthesis